MPTLHPDLILKQIKKRRIRRRRIPPDEQNLERRTQFGESNVNSSPRQSVLPIPPEIPPPHDLNAEFSGNSLQVDLPTGTGNSAHSRDILTVDMHILQDTVIITDGTSFLGKEALSDVPINLELPKHHSHESRGSVKDAAVADIDWNPSLARECTKFVGKPCEKPSVSTVSSSIVEATSRRNRRKVCLNIRRKKMLIWIFAFTLLLNNISFATIFQRMLSENDKIFSMTIIKPWAIPYLIVELALNGIGFLTILAKMKYMHVKIVGHFHRIIMAFNNLQYLLAIVGLPLAMYHFCEMVFSDMQRNLEIDKASELERNAISLSWNITQVERKCCGFQSRHDWHPNSTGSIETNEGAFYVMIHNEMEYPSTCCGDLSENVNTLVGCTEGSKRFWKQGCREAEFNVILEYSIYFMCLLFVSLVVSVLIRILIDKLERYLTIFRPREMF